jgi:hypothetical protein
LNASDSQLHQDYTTSIDSGKTTDLLDTVRVTTCSFSSCQGLSYLFCIFLKSNIDLLEITTGAFIKNF